MNSGQSFDAVIEIIGVNPFVFVPEEILDEIFEQANRNKGAVPVKGTLNSIPFLQTLVKYSGFWRLYLNGELRKKTNTKVGDNVSIFIEFDNEARIVEMPVKLKLAMEDDKEAKMVFDSLSPSRKLEIKRYINNLKNESTIDKNVLRAINFLKGNSRFVGRDKP